MSGCKIEGPRGSVEFGVMQIPDRKSRCLYAMRGAMIEPLAYFRTDECADRFERVIDYLVTMDTDRGKEPK